MRVDPLAPVHAEIMQTMGWEPGVYKGRWMDTPQAGSYEAAGWKKGNMLRRICPMYGYDAHTIPEMTMYLWDLGFALQLRYTGEWVYASIHKVTHYGKDETIVMSDPLIEAASELTNVNASVCCVFLDAVRRYEESEAKKKAAIKRKNERAKERRNGKTKKDQA